tara:strand:- start:12337 stop:12663 length:327 start_codon:yes stop_codon:yes gene_type:complete
MYQADCLPITEDIVENILNAKCIIADLTYARPSVYFEVGYAHGLPADLLLTCREDHHRGIKDDAKIHFDLEQFKISFWSVDSNGNFKWRKNMDPQFRLGEILKKIDNR